ncbi:MAG: DUF4258 domain-containing protein [Candidatus Wallbacteria bacterium]|nr:DUF4258 domain-containing protein [Candidatus Wallbacteria bacterium]
MFDINTVISALKDKKIRITDHSDEEAQNDGLSYDEIFCSVMNGEIIENYPDDTPYPRGKNDPL